MNTVNVLFGFYGFDYGYRINLSRQRQLDQDAINIVVVVKVLDAGDDLVFGRGMVEKTQFSMEANRFTILRLKAHIDVGRRVVANQDDAPR